ncbi:DUF1508 domain-containing protein [Herbaspirillum sp. SJZ107]|uniref:YegP family protein n=1 Tax=Herbaspirillum sp. SJZ107 TaxID=2572881 RepID=UPI00114E2D17|nr:DUF1508 domain-containing protein [Herbaspirillum sp. SJZ107]TQK07004.1 uncharacterized protein YegP (UPF0339 family) [Herbaspirillum sp. SJZ107]
MHFEIYEQKQNGLLAAAGGSGDYRWRLRADNDRIIADSGEGYRNKSDCLHGINLVKGTTAATSVVDSTLRNALAGLLGTLNQR